ncbi:putative F-box domain, kelch-type beta propeller, F-box associated interaction [Helianthus annuus]|uniref:F-box domain, kelch-type beta propeller, F-box associated interaction n=2 Tax=Helianthus annuus TaxID=4232 RepID=A0A251V6X6_HELAN|nr:putative F-box domain, kelch-type beta propeller, F-box associated interaction [Helianthus annuus]KAJ0593109.1 putative F-box domain, kelch-type beta propeller, F-box associated interaction [Helianthus annuus]KAJ0600899.1 putative F-box domain, kelch-type beta propeller, F-box associated interaction [Helianthus annuus]KAJ0608119.1 putative F-box domain, kelch-type beta propeller, F-box associated interaction [Helianthus annuus]KAJ0768187.1 putative F-box domain, kelch-type beta propeller, F-
MHINSHQTLDMVSQLHPSMEDKLPENVMFDILSRLSVKSVIYCKCVCKKWRNLVSDSYFVHLHHSRLPSCLMIDCGPILELVEVEHEVEYHRLTLNHVKTLNLHLSAVHASNQIFQVDSVNGLICVCHRYDATYIFNPVVEEYMILPAEPGLKRLLLSYGFGVSMQGEYKVIRISGRRISLNPSVHVVEIDVYTLGTDQWRSLGQTPYYLYNLLGKVSSGVFVSGHVYWIAYGQIYDFDLTTETFKLFTSPPGDNQRSKQMLGVLKGSLSHFSWCWLGLEVWVMKEESWYKVLAIPENIKCLVDGSNGTT